LTADNCVDFPLENTSELITIIHLRYDLSKYCVSVTGFDRRRFTHTFLHCLSCFRCV